MPVSPQPLRRNLRRSAAAALALALFSGIALAPAASADDIRNREYWLDQYGITAAWNTSQGEGVKVAIIDSGVDSSHKDLAGAVVGGVDMSGSGNGNGTKGVGSEPEHGTLVATMLAGRGHTDPSSSPVGPSTPPGVKAGAGPDGVVGVAPKAELLSISVWLGSENPSGKTVDDQIPAAVKWAVDHGARVINMSLGSTSTAWPESWDDAFSYAESKDVVIVAAAGNRASGSEQVGAPATIPGVLAVGGLDKNGAASNDSSSQGISIGVSAPAEDLAGGLPGGGYARWSGTSGAAPIVAGVAALIRSKYPDMSAAQVINRIISSAKPKGDGVPNAIYGYGLLDANAALTADIPVVEANPLGSIADWIRVHRRVAASAPTAGATVSAEPVSGPTVADRPAPSAARATELSGPAPAAIVLGFGGLLLLIVAAGSTHLLVVRRKLTMPGSSSSTDVGTAEPSDSDAAEPVASGAAEPTDVDTAESKDSSVQHKGSHQR